uniref:Uncharacterized protein n=1 Tax=Onchocerca volvulus TaxID=6282 RepID=A0A8R1XZR4_ONCVO
MQMISRIADNALLDLELSLDSDIPLEFPRLQAVLDKASLQSVIEALRRSRMFSKISSTSACPLRVLAGWDKHAEHVYSSENLERNHQVPLEPTTSRWTPKMEKIDIGMFTQDEIKDFILSRSLLC